MRPWHLLRPGSLTGVLTGILDQHRNVQTMLKGECGSVEAGDSDILGDIPPSMDTLIGLWRWKTSPKEPRRCIRYSIISSRDKKAAAVEILIWVGWDKWRADARVIVGNQHHVHRAHLTVVGRRLFFSANSAPCDQPRPY